MCFESLGRGKTQESSQKEDLFSSENIVRFQNNCFVKYQNDFLGAFMIISVSLVKQIHQVIFRLHFSALDFHLGSNLCPGRLSPSCQGDYRRDIKIPSNCPILFLGPPRTTHCMQRKPIPNKESVL